MINENERLWVVDHKSIRVMSKPEKVIGILKNGYINFECYGYIHKNYVFKTKKEALMCCILIHKSIIASSERQIGFLTKKMEEN
jgi:hypothetical protein